MNGLSSLKIDEETNEREQAVEEAMVIGWGDQILLTHFLSRPITLLKVKELIAGIMRRFTHPLSTIALNGESG